MEMSIDEEAIKRLWKEWPKPWDGVTIEWEREVEDNTDEFIRLVREVLCIDKDESLGGISDTRLAKLVKKYV